MKSFRRHQHKNPTPSNRILGRIFRQGDRVFAVKSFAGMIAAVRCTAGIVFGVGRTVDIILGVESIAESVLW